MRVLIPFWLGVPERWFYQEFAVSIAEALGELGHQVSYFPFNDAGRLSPNEQSSLHRQVDRDKPDVVLDIACWGFGLSLTTVPDAGRSPQPIFDAYRIPYVGMLFDHPFNQAINRIASRRLHAVYPDLGHPHQLRLVYPGLTLAGEVFAPPAIRPANDRSSGRAPADRSIDVLYVGNFEPSATERFWHDPAYPNLPADVDPQFCDAVADTVMAAPERSLHLSIKEVAGHYSRSAGFSYYTQLRCVEWFLRQGYRRRAVTALAQAGVRMRVVGRQWQHLAPFSNVVLQEPTDYDGLFRLAGAARICIDASTYLDG
ncbi:MAG: hypothetical protein JO184_18530, partial [Gammaproteobacteria bacterium]|nr:hypothetical protein [Gammaproteobacteria bacterium]